MNIEESPNPTTTHYQEREEKKYWGVYWLHKANFSLARIGRLVGMSKSTVQSIVQRIQEKGKDPFVSYNQILAELRLHEIHISKPTLVRYLHAQGFGSYFAAHKPNLTDKQIRERLRWAKERVNWTKEEWRGVVWSDESRFAVEGYDGGARVTRKAGERYNIEHIKSVSKFGQGSVMLWGCFWAGGFGPLVFVDGAMSQDAYVNLLAENFLPWYANLTEQEDREFIIQEDRATFLPDGYTTWWRDLHQIRRLDKWPSNSPDLNPMEHVWACLERLIERERGNIRNPQQLKATLEEAWRGISLDFCERLVASMQDRCQAVIDAKGGPTKY